jgi:TPR repeat protein
MYENGFGVEQSYERAKHYYEQAAHLGHVDAQYNLGILYEHGKGVEQSHERAIEYYKQGAHLGHADAQVNLGCLYANGLGVERDMIIAREWLAKAAAQGHETAIKYLKQLDGHERQKMSTTSSNSNTIVCSNCETPQTESHKLIRCPCHSVRYCNKECQKKHRKKHKKACRRLMAERKLTKQAQNNNSEGKEQGTKTKQNKEKEEQGERKEDTTEQTKEKEEEGDECPSV